MNKKKILRELLNKIEPYRDMARGILILMDGDKLENSMIEYLIYFLHKVIKKIQTKQDISGSIQQIYTQELEEKNLLYKLKQQIIQHGLKDNNI